jgi:hypothetical protein
MVQFFQGGPSRSQLISDILGPALGESLGNFAGSYFANKTLQDTLKDKSLQNKPLSERWELLQSRLAPHGRHGEKVFEKNMLVEQQRQSEKQEKLDKKKSFLFQKLLNKQPLTEQESQLFTPKELTDVANYHQKIDLQNLKNAGKSPMGGLGGQPIPEDQINRIEEVIKAFPQANDDQLALEMAKRGVNPYYFRDYLENRRSQLDLSQKNAQQDFENKFKIHKEEAKFDEEVYDKAKNAEDQLEAISNIFHAIRSGNVKPSNFSNILRGFGVVGDKLADAFLNKDQAEFSASIPQLIVGMKDIFGVRLSDADLRVVKDKLPDIGKSSEANEAILKVIEKYANISIQRAKIAGDVKKENAGYRSLNYRDEVENRLNEWKKETFKQNRVITDEVMDHYLDMFNGDPDQASAQAEKEGYVLSH